MLEYIYIVTEHLLIRRVERRDIKDVFKFVNNDIINKYMINTKHQNIQETYGWYEHLNPMDAEYVILKRSGEVIGMLSIIPTTDDRIMECGIGILPEYQGNHFAVEALNATLDVYVESRVSDAFVAQVAQTNIPSCKVFRRLGFTVLGTSSYSKEDRSVAYPCYIFVKRYR